MWEAEIKDKKAMETFWDSLWIQVCRSHALGQSHEESGQHVDSGNAVMYPWEESFNICDHDHLCTIWDAGAILHTTVSSFISF